MQLWEKGDRTKTFGKGCFSCDPFSLHFFPFFPSFLRFKIYATLSLFCGSSSEENMELYRWRRNKHLSISAQARNRSHIYNHGLSHMTIMASSRPWSILGKTCLLRQINLGKNWRIHEFVLISSNSLEEWKRGQMYLLSL